MVGEICIDVGGYSKSRGIAIRYFALCHTLEFAGGFCCGHDHKENHERIRGKIMTILIRISPKKYMLTE